MMPKYLLLGLIWLLPLGACAQIITTIAGTGYKGSGGDGGPAISADLQQPVSICIDDSGSIYIVDIGNSNIRKISPSGIISTIVGVHEGHYYDPAKGYNGDDGPATNAIVWKPRAIITDHAGNVYFGDYENSIIRKVGQNKRVSSIAGFPQKYGFGQRGDSVNYAVSFTSAARAQGSKIEDHLYFADEHNNMVQRIDKDGKIQTIAGTGTRGYKGDGGQANKAELNRPWCVVQDRKGNIFIADTYNNVIRKINTEGIISTYAGNGLAGYKGDGGAATDACINSPHGIALDGEGNLFVTDVVAHVVRMVDAEAIISTYAGNGQRGYKGDKGAATAAMLNSPSDVAIDRAGNLLIADWQNHVIRKITKLKTRQPVKPIKQIEPLKLVSLKCSSVAQKVLKLVTVPEPPVSILPLDICPLAIMKTSLPRPRKLESVGFMSIPRVKDEIQKISLNDIQKIETDLLNRSRVSLQVVPELEIVVPNEFLPTPKDELLKAKYSVVYKLRQRENKPEEIILVDVPEIKIVVPMENIPRPKDQIFGVRLSTPNSLEVSVSRLNIIGYVVVPEIKIVAPVELFVAPKDQIERMKTLAIHKLSATLKTTQLVNYVEIPELKIAVPKESVPMPKDQIGRIKIVANYMVLIASKTSDTLKCFYVPELRIVVPKELLPTPKDTIGKILIAGVHRLSMHENKASIIHDRLVSMPNLAAPREWLPTPKDSLNRTDVLGLLKVNINQSMATAARIVDVPNPAIVAPVEKISETFKIEAESGANELVVTIDSGAYTSYTITELTGKTVAEDVIVKQVTRVDINQLSSGRYYLNLKNGEKVKSAMFVKER